MTTKMILARLISLEISFSKGVEVHWLAIAALITFTSGAVNASEPVAESMPVTEVASSIVSYDLPPTYSPGIAGTGEFKAAARLKPGYKKVAKKSKPKKSMLSRTERNQMALMAVKLRPTNSLSLAFLNDEDVESGADDLDIHRSLSRPKVARTFDQDDDEEEIEISDHAKVRLFLARMKAVQAHQSRFS